jgi:alcohol dehydrogenase (NADP+)
MIATRAYAAASARVPLAPFSLERRAIGARDVHIAIAYSGVCHSDIHQARDEWGGAQFPMVPGHEIAGTVVSVGDDVSRVRVGDRVGVGCMVNSCRSCASCTDGLEQFCSGGVVWTYNSREASGAITYGGYSNHIVVDEAFVLRIAESLDFAATAPLLCAGITTYSPLRHWRVGAGQRVGVVGLGGLGHMALKFARAFGAHVIQFTTSTSKVEDALRLGANEVVLTTDKAALKHYAGTLDFILDTVSAPHDIARLMTLLTRDGTMTLVGVPERPHMVPANALINGRRSLAGSLIGGIAETQEMLDFCAAHGITSDIELIPMSAINEAYERMLKGDVRYRFVIDAATI